MENNHYNDRRPSALEEQAYSEAKKKFAEHLRFGGMPFTISNGTLLRSPTPSWKPLLDEQARAMRC